MVLKITNLSFGYTDELLLKNINIDVEKGQIVSIIGGSGVGKTTLFNIIAGIYELQQGTILLNDSSDYKGKISYMLQKDLLLEHKTILQNIMLPLTIKKINKNIAIKEATDALKLFDLIDYKDSYPKELSGGMRQRVALLRTYMMKNDLFLLDEPFSALDSITKIKMHNWYLAMRKKLNLTTLLITHDIDEAISLSDVIYILKDRPGQIAKKIVIDKNKGSEEYMVEAQYKKEILNILNL